MRRLSSYFLIGAASLLLVGATFGSVMKDSTSNIEYQNGRELLFRVSSKDDTSTTTESISKEDTQTIIDEMKTRLDNSDVSKYSVELQGNDTIRVVLSEEYSSYNRLITYLTFNGKFALTNGLDDVALGRSDDSETTAEGFLTDSPAYIETINGYPAVVLPVNTESAEYKKVLEGAREAKDKGETGFETSSDEQNGDTNTWYMYLWYDYSEDITFENRENPEISSRLLNKYEIMATDEDQYYPDDEHNKLCSVIGIQSNSPADRKVAYDNARFFVNLINTEELPFTVSYINNSVDGGTGTVIEAFVEPLVSLGEITKSVTTSKTFKATIIATALIIVILAVYFRMSAFAIASTTIASTFLSVASMVMLTAEINTMAIIGAMMVAIISLVSGTLYSQKVKDAVYKGRSLKKANAEASKKSLAITIDLHVVLFIFGVFAYVLGGPLMKSFAASTVVGSLASLILNLTMLKGMMWLLTNSSKVQGKYGLLGIDSTKVPDSFKEEKQSFFGAYADKDFSKNKKKAKIITVASVAACAVAMIISASITGNIYANQNISYNSAIYFETTSENSTMLDEATINNKILSNMFVYEDDKDEAKPLVDYVDFISSEYTYSVYFETEKKTVNHYVYVCKLNDTLDESINAYFKTDAKTIEENNTNNSKLINDIFDAVVSDKTITTDSKMTISLKSSSEFSPVQPLVGKIILAAGVAAIICGLYYAIRYGLVKGVVVLASAGATLIVTSGFFSLVHLFVNPYVVGAVPCACIFLFALMTIVLNKNKEIISEDKKFDYSLESKENAMKKAVSYTHGFVIVLSLIAIYLFVNFFALCPERVCGVYGFIGLSMLLGYGFITYVFGSLTSSLTKAFKNIKMPERRKKKFSNGSKKVNKSAEPEEAIFIGIND